MVNVTEDVVKVENFFTTLAVLATMYSSSEVERVTES
jgi:hypothetical protein